MEETFERLGYEAYAKSTGGKTYDGRDMPAWDDLPDRIKCAWYAAWRAIVDRERERSAPPLSQAGEKGDAP